MTRTGPRYMLRRLAKRSVITASGCVEWNGQRANGYGRLRIDGQLRQAHRISYVTFVGPIPDGLELDHLCRNRACWNPHHLEPVTQRENLMRAMTCPPALNAAKTHCLRGHEFNDENTIWTNAGGRQCRPCERIRDAAKRAARSAS